MMYHCAVQQTKMPDERRKVVLPELLQEAKSTYVRYGHFECLTIPATMDEGEHMNITSPVVLCPMR